MMDSAKPFFNPNPQNTIVQCSYILYFIIINYLGLYIAARLSLPLVCLTQYITPKPPKKHSVTVDSIFFFFNRGVK